jgi:predicted nucleic acid-binding protein
MGMIEISNTVAVCDAGPLIHLDELESLDFLSDFSRIIVPSSVWNEVVLHRPNIFNRQTPFFEKAIESNFYDEEVVALGSMFLLHTGEIDAIRCVRQIQKGILLTDDSAARLAAKTLGINAHGTIGILIRSIRQKRKTTQEIISLMQTIPQKSTLFIKKSTLSSIIDTIRLSSAK